MSPQNQNRNGKSIGFFKATSMIALLLGTTSLTTPEVYASKLALALAADLSEKEGIDRAEAQSIVNMAMRKDALHPEAVFDEFIKTKQEGHIDSFIEAEREFLQSNQPFDDFIASKKMNYPQFITDFNNVRQAAGVRADLTEDDATIAILKIIIKGNKDFLAGLDDDPKKLAFGNVVLSSVDLGVEKGSFIATYFQNRLNEVTDDTIADAARLVHDDVGFSVSPETMALIAHLRTINKPGAGAYTRDDIDEVVFERARLVKAALNADPTTDTMADADRLSVINQTIDADTMALFAAIRGNANLPNRDDITAADMATASAAARALGKGVDALSADEWADANRANALGISLNNQNLTAIRAIKAGGIKRSAITVELLNAYVGSNDNGKAAVLAAFGADNTIDLSGHMLAGLRLIGDNHGAAQFNDAADADIRDLAARLVELGYAQKIQNTAQYGAYMAAADAVGINNLVNKDALDKDSGVKAANRATDDQKQDDQDYIDFLTGIDAEFIPLESLTDADINAVQTGADANAKFVLFLSYRLFGANHTAQHNLDAVKANGFCGAIVDRVDGKTRVDWNKARLNADLLVADIRDNGSANVAAIVALTKGGVRAKDDAIDAANAYITAQTASRQNFVMGDTFVNAWIGADEIDNYSQGDVRAALTQLAVHGHDLNDDNQNIALLAMAAGDTVGNVFSQFGLSPAFDAYKAMLDAGFFVDADDQGAVNNQTQGNIAGMAAAYPANNDNGEQDAWHWIIENLGRYYQQNRYGQTEIQADLPHVQALLQGGINEDKITWGMVESLKAGTQNAMEAAQAIANAGDINVALASRAVVDHLAAAIQSGGDGSDILNALKAFSVEDDIREVNPSLVNAWIVAKGQNDGSDEAIVALAKTANQYPWAFAVNDDVITAYLANNETTEDAMDYLLGAGHDMQNIDANLLKAAHTFNDANIDASDSNDRNTNILNALNGYVALAGQADNQAAFLALLTAQQEGALDQAGFDIQRNVGDLIPGYTAINTALETARAGNADNSKDAAKLAIHLRDTLIQDWNTTPVKIDYNNVANYDVQGTADEVNAALVSLITGGVEVDNLDKITAEDIAIARQSIIDESNGGNAGDFAQAVTLNGDPIANIAALVTDINRRGGLGLAALGI